MPFPLFGHSLCDTQPGFDIHVISLTRLCNPLTDKSFVLKSKAFLTNYVTDCGFQKIIMGNVCCVV